jgi:hypothetical protein
VKIDANPMQSAHNAARCKATAKSTGIRCGAPAVRGWAVCRMHGARGGAPPNDQHPNFKTGLRSKRYTKLRKLAMALAKNSYPV